MSSYNEKLRERFLAMFEEMKNSSTIDITYIKAEITLLEQSDIEFHVSESEKSLGYKLADYFRDCFLSHDEIWLHWQYDLDGEYENGGEFRLINLSEVFLNLEGLDFGTRKWKRKKRNFTKN